MFENNKLKSNLLLGSTMTTSSNLKSSILLTSTLTSTTSTKSSLLPKSTTPSLLTATTSLLSKPVVGSIGESLINERKKKSDLSGSSLGIDLKKPKLVSNLTHFEPINKDRLVGLTQHTLPSSSLVSSLVKPLSVGKTTGHLTLNSTLLALSNKTNQIEDSKAKPVHKRQLSAESESENMAPYVEDNDQFGRIFISTLTNEIRQCEQELQRAKKKIKTTMESVVDPVSVHMAASPKVQLISLKTAFINSVSASLLSEPNFKNVNDPTRQLIFDLSARLMSLDPEFVLKLALYTRRELNIRVTANFLVCLASFNEATRPYLQRYFKQTVQLPSDWIDIAEQYQLLTDKRINFGALPSALRKCMVEKFLDFDKYQLAKYNKEKSRLAKNSKIKDVKHTKAKLKDNEDGAPAAIGQAREVEDKYVKTLRKGLAISDRILVEVVVRDKCNRLKIDIMQREAEQKPPAGRFTRAKPGAAKSSVERHDQVALRVNFDYENRRIAHKSFLGKEWSKRSQNENKPKFTFTRSAHDSTFVFVDVHADRFTIGTLTNGTTETTLSSYEHSKHNIQLFKLNSIRVSGVDIKLKDLQVKSKEIVHMDSQNEADNAAAVRQRSYTLKQLIRQLHINAPVDNVMSLLGKKYPGSFEEFIALKLPGMYEAERAGKRMKLPTPETWETQISLKGNKAQVWEQLIDNKKLPYMAMLRNLRNMIKCGISEKHHQWVIKKLQDEGAVIHSKQFPFRFFTAYEVLSDLEEEFNKYIEWSQSNGAAPSVPQPRRKFADKKKTDKEARKKQDMNYDTDILKRYKVALDNALKVATTYNVSPISGRSIILLYLGHEMTTKTSKAANRLGKRVNTVADIGALLALMFKYSCEHSKFIVFEHGYVHVNVELQEGTILDNMQRLVNLRNIQQSPGQPIDTVYPRRVLDDILQRKETYDNFILLGPGVTDVEYQKQFLRKYRALVNDRLLFVNVNLTVDSCSLTQNVDFDHQNDVCISGFSDSILRFVAERGNQGQLVHVDNIHTAYDLPELKWKKKTMTADEESELSRLEQRLSLVERPNRLKLIVPAREWRTVKVFISSTFRDMHAERDLLARTIFPLLRSKLAAYFINVYEIDLRWGITETEANHNQTLDVCLSQVLASDYFLGILGERYGNVANSPYSVRANPALRWLESYPAGASITELEIETQLRKFNEKTDLLERSFFYFRDRSFVNDVPADLLNHFVDENDFHRLRLDQLKKKIRSRSLEIYDGYSCKWNKFDTQRSAALVSSLESFGIRVFANLFNAISQHFRDQISAVEMDEWVHLNGLTDTYIRTCAESLLGKEKLIDRFAKLIDDTKYQATYNTTTEAAKLIADEKNSLVNMLLLSGASGCGKTTFLAGYLYTHAEADLPHRHVHMVGAYAGSEYTTLLLKRACIHLNREYALQLNEQAMNDSTEFKYFKKQFELVLIKLAQILVNQKFYFIVDGVGDLVDENGAADLSFGWLPDKIPPFVTFIFTARSNSPVPGILAKLEMSNRAVNKIKVTNVEVEPLDVLDRGDFIKQQLARFNKQLDESAFNNQMKMLTGKRDAAQPFYLTMACEQLRQHGQFETLTDKIKELPIKLDKLVDYVLQQLIDQHGQTFTTAAFMFLCCSRDGLYESELRSMLTLFNGLEACNAVGLVENCPSLIELDPAVRSRSFKAGRPVPTAKFLTFVESISAIFLRSRKEAILAVKKNPLIETALRARFLSANLNIRLMHKIMAMYYWREIDPEWEKNWSPSGNVRAYSYLPFHLGLSESHLDLVNVLCDVSFIAAKCQLGLGAELTDDFDMNKTYVERNILQTGVSSTAKKASTRSQAAATATVETGGKKFLAYKLFLMSNINLLMKKPELIYQQAINESETSDVCSDLKQLLRTKPNLAECYIFQWVNKSLSNEYGLSPTQLDAFDSSPVSSVCLGEKYVVCGTDNCEIKLFERNTGRLVRTYRGHSGRVNSLRFVDGERFVSTASDGLACVWSVNEGYRVRVLNRHNDHVVRDCCVDKAGRSVITVGWDCTAKIWKVDDGTQQADLRHPRPVNCVVFNPEGSLIATGCWDACIRIYNYVDRVRRAILRGHGASIAAVSYSNNGVYLASSAIDGEVKLWNSINGAQLASLKGHSMPVNSLSFSPTSQFLITGSADRRVKVWSGSVGKMINVIRDTQSPADVITSVCFNQSDGTIAAGTHSGQLRFYDIYVGSLKARLNVHKAAVRRLKYTPCGNFLISACDQGTVRMINCWDEPSPGADLTVENSKSITALDVSKQHTVITGTEDCRLFLYATVADQGTDKIRPLHTMDEHKSPVTSCAFDPVGDRFASADKDALIVVWKLSLADYSASILHRLDHAHQDWITDVKWSQSAANFLLSSSNDFTCKIWNVTTGACKSTLTGHTANINACSFNYGCAVSAASDGSVKIWSHRGYEIATLAGHQSRVNACDLYFKIRPRIVVEKTKENDDDDTNMEIGLLWSEQVEQDTLKSMKTTSSREPDVQIDDVYLVTCSDDATIRVWKPVESDYLLSLESHNGAVNSLDLDRQHTLATGSDDSTVNLWSMGAFFERIKLGHGHDRSSSAGKTHYTEVRSLCLNAGQDRLLSGSQDGALIVWKIHDAGMEYMTDFRPHDSSCDFISILTEYDDVAHRYVEFATGCENEPVKLWKLSEARKSGEVKLQLLRQQRVNKQARLVYMSRYMDGDKVRLLTVEQYWQRVSVRLLKFDQNSEVHLSGCEIGNVNGMISRVELTGPTVYITYVNQHVHAVDLSQCLTKVQPVYLMNLTETSKSFLRVIGVSNTAPAAECGSKAVWFTSLAHDGKQLIAADWSGNVYATVDSAYTLVKLKQINQCRTSRLATFRTRLNDQPRVLTCSQEGEIKVWTGDFATQLGFYKNTSEITQLLTLSGQPGVLNNYTFVFGDKMGNVNLLKWYE